MPDPASLLAFVQSVSGVGLCWVDVGTRALHLEPRARELLAIDGAASLDWPQFLERFDERGRAALERAVQAAPGGLDEVFELRARLHAPAAPERTLKIRGRLTHDPPGRGAAVLLAVEEEEAPASGALVGYAMAMVGIGMWELDLDSGRERWCAKTLELYGLPADGPAPTRDEWRERFLHPDDAVRQAQRAAVFLAGDGQPYEMDYRVRRADGRVRWLHSRAAFLPGPGRRVVGLTMDITERKEAELGAAEAWQLLDMSAAQVGFGFGYRDRSLGIGHWSTQLKRMYGLPPAAPTPSQQELLQWVVPESRQVVAGNLQRQAAVGEVFEFRHDIRRVSDGERRTLLTRSVWLADAAGQPWRICFATVDITDQLARERQVSEALQRLQMATQALGIGTWERDIDAERGRWDDTTLALFGLPPGAPAPTHDEYLQLIHPLDRDWMVERFHPSRTATSEDLEFTFRVQRPDGVVRWLHVLGSGEFNGEGRVVRRVGICMDVTERRVAEEALHAKELAERANQAKTQFLSRMSHELRTPLNAVLGFAQLMALDANAPLSPTQQQRLQRMQGAGWHLLALIDDVLDLTSVESREARLKPQWVRLAEVVEEVLAFNEPAAAREQVTLHADRAARDLRVWVDPRRVKQVLVNLVSNAVKYNRPGGRVDVSCSASASELTVCVRDTGPGIEAERMPELFQPFNRLGRESGAIAGTGIGLTLSRQLAELMGGRLEADSQLGVGSEFRLVLPVVAGPAGDY
ncbi:MAG: PAS domain-containing protein [Rubrivivax sp.]|nr:PAS domain-containing protein [Rubrivivax sp.]